MFLRRLRAIGFMAILWGMAWVPLGIALALFGYWRQGPVDYDVTWPPDRLQSLLIDSVLIFGISGILMGAAFAILLMVNQRNRSFSELSMRRFIVLGAAGALLVSVLTLSAEGLQPRYDGWWIDSATMLAVAGTVGGLTAAGTFRLASGPRGSAAVEGNTRA